MTIPLKAWVIDEARREGVGARAIYTRLHSGKYPHLSMIRKNRKVVLVTNSDMEKPATLPLKLWIELEASVEGLSKSAIFNRLYRGKYPWLPLKRVNQRVVLVELHKQYDWCGLGALTEGR